MTEPNVLSNGHDDPTADELQQIARALRGLRFGSVNIIVQDGVVVQIDRTEKRRLRNRGEVTTRS